MSKRKIDKIRLRYNFIKYRCNNPIKYPDYINVTLCNEWLDFNVFKVWYENNHIEGYELDKDLLRPSSNMYSPDTCCFIPKSINMLITNKRKGRHLKGTEKVSSGKFRACMKKYNKNVHLGTFDTELQAHNKYKEEKRKHIVNIADDYHNKNLISTNIYKALLVYPL